MTKLFGSGLLVWFMAGVVVAQVTQQTDHIYNPNFVVKAYELSSAKETEYFSNTDGEMSTFWRVWSAEGVAPLDQIELEHDVHYSEGSNFSIEPAQGYDDVGVVVKIAYGDEGIYILYEVRDDNWVGYVAAADYVNDAIDIFGEQRSAEELYGSPSVYFPCLSDATFSHQLSEAYFQIQVRFGGPELVEEFSMNWWRSDLVGLPVSSCAPGAGGDGLVQYNRTITFSGAEATYNIYIEILPPEDNWRRQEWRIPWSVWGGPNPPHVTRRSSGEKVAVCLGYNDLDLGQLDRTALRWRKSDPYTNDPVAGTSVDSWGDILFDESFEDILSAAGATWADVEATATRRGPGRIAAGSKVVKTEFFTVDGQRIGAPIANLRNRTANVVLKKMVFADNTSRTVRVPLGAIR